MQKLFRWVTLLFLLSILVSCGQTDANTGLKKVGLLVPNTIDDQVWGTEGYKGLLQIKSKFQVDVFYKEGITSEAATRTAVNEFADKGVNLIFGHGSEYAEIFNEIADDYPDVQFVFFNGNTRKENVTSLNFEGHAMGFFGGMVAGKMTEANKVGIIAAFEWQPEINGFYEGVLFQNDKVDVDIGYVQNWDDDEKAISIAEKMIADGIDIIYPAGDGYNVPVIERLKEDGLYAIGYVSDQSDLGKETVYTSTVQHIDQLYLLVANQFNNDELASGTLYFDFQDDVISMGTFSPKVDEKFVKELKGYIKEYKETGDLPSK
ncbi:BMP family ABC transporter substrate-binding protein [Bacillus sp. REN16]|uniref:BMP family ABC transporter substrate-binding protein n=1 Tax=Bacillus sp. REN16 TaxID=2887296 RepID=UPI001E5C19E7|nr:BMP family ABC transporter substrate-binding protein [Bacillus sp. REN16]MCC3355597.1 BMP family ABC transporter substrate-binding protein [Bacillus sp. REN16]